MPELIDIWIKYPPTLRETRGIDSKGTAYSLGFAKGILLQVPEMGDDIDFGVHLDPQDAKWVVTHLASGLRMCKIKPEEMLDEDGKTIRLTTAARIAVGRRRIEVGNTWAKMRAATLAAPTLEK